MADYAQTRLRWSDPKGDGTVVDVEEGEVVKKGTFPPEVMAEFRESGAVADTPPGSLEDLNLIVASKDAEIEALRARLAEAGVDPDEPKAEPEAPAEPKK